MKDGQKICGSCYFLFSERFFDNTHMFNQHHWLHNIPDRQLLKTSEWQPFQYMEMSGMVFDGFCMTDSLFAVPSRLAQWGSMGCLPRSAFD